MFGSSVLTAEHPGLDAGKTAIQRRTPQPCPNWSFARSQGSCHNGTGKRNGLRRLFLRAPLLDTIPGGVLRVLGSPVRLRLLPPRRLTLRPATGALPRSHSWVGTEPMA